MSTGTGLELRDGSSSVGQRRLDGTRIEYTNLKTHRADHESYLKKKIKSLQVSDNNLFFEEEHLMARFKHKHVIAITVILYFIVIVVVLTS